MIGSLFYEFGTSKEVRVYINGEEVSEPVRRIMRSRRGGEDIKFKPKLRKGVPEQDAFVMKVVRPRGNVPAIFTLEGWGPAGTLYGSRILLENRKILSDLAKFKLREF